MSKIEKQLHGRNKSPPMIGTGTHRYTGMGLIMIVPHLSERHLQKLGFQSVSTVPQEISANSWKTPVL